MREDQLKSMNQDSKYVAQHHSDYAVNFSELHRQTKSYLHYIRQMQTSIGAQKQLSRILKNSEQKFQLNSHTNYHFYPNNQQRCKHIDSINNTIKNLSEQLKNLYIQSQLIYICSLLVEKSVLRQSNNDQKDGDHKYQKKQQKKCAKINKFIPGKVQHLQADLAKKQLINDIIHSYLTNLRKYQKFIIDDLNEKIQDDEQKQLIFETIIKNRQEIELLQTYDQKIDKNNKIQEVQVFCKQYLIVMKQHALETNNFFLYNLIKIIVNGYILQTLNQLWTFSNNSKQLNKIKLFKPYTIENNVCCLNYCYKYQQLSIQNNLIYNNQENIVFLQGQLIDNFHKLEQTIAGLLNSENGRGYIFLGVKNKHNTYKAYGFKFTLKDANIAREKIFLCSENIQPKISSDEMTVDFIPIFEGYNFAQNKWIYEKSGQVLIKISIRSDRNKRIYLRHIKDRFFKFDAIKQQTIEIKSTEIDKDNLYKSMKSMYFNYSINSKSIFTQKNFYESSHYWTCRTNYINIMPDSFNKNGQNEIAIENENEDNEGRQQNKDKMREFTKQIKQSDTISGKNLRYTSLLVIDSKNRKQFQQFMQSKNQAIRLQRKFKQFPLTTKTILIYHHQRFNFLNKDVEDFNRHHKKQNKNERKVILISTAPSVYIEREFQQQQLEFTKQFLYSYEQKGEHIFKLQNVSLEYVKVNNKVHTYIKTTSNLAAIYIYFLLDKNKIKSRLQKIPQSNSVQIYGKPVNYMDKNSR